MRLFIVAAWGVITGQESVRAAEPAPRPPAFQKMVDCRGVANPVQRLACFDREVA
ncbi:MAG: hypothetical protein AVDCRST_MAG91-3679, partial [uncultured Sphingomonadaceae bacterium]